MSIKAKRLSAKMTQSELSSALGISRSTLAMWEIGKNYPRVEFLIRMSDLLNCKIDELLREEVPEEKNESNSQTFANLEN